MERPSAFGAGILDGGGASVRSGHRRGWRRVAEKVSVTEPLDPRPGRSPERLLDTSPSASTPFLLELARRQAVRRSPRDLLAQHGRDGFVAPSPLDLRTVHAFDGLALGATREFEALQLAP